MSESVCDCGDAAVLLPPEVGEPICLRCQVFLSALISSHPDPSVAAKGEAEVLWLTGRFPGQPIRSFVEGARERLRENPEWVEVRNRLLDQA